MSMDYHFNICRQNRKIIKNFLEEISTEDLLTIPERFNNNIWWNLVHVVVTQQLLLYKLSGLKPNLPERIVTNYSKGSRPDEKPSEQDISLIKNALLDLVEQSKDDYKNGVFKNYNSYTTSLNVTLNSVEDAIAFNNFHEGIHLGSILALRRALGIAS